MIKLYDKFMNWYQGGVIWLISDTHFNDADCKLMNENWPTPEEHIKIINSKVGKKDTLIHLGDVGDIEYVQKLKGYKVLICGNHDKGVSNYIKKYSIYLDKDVFNDSIENLEYANELVEELKIDYPYLTPSIRDNRLFDEVYEGPLFINNKILLSHEPITIPFGINIHGHSHKGVKENIIPNKSAQINLVSDIRNWEPIRLDRLVTMKTEDIHRQAINKASENPLHKNANNLL